MKKIRFKSGSSSLFFKSPDNAIRSHYRYLKLMGSISNRSVTTTIS